MSAIEGNDILAETQLPAPRTVADYYHLRELLEVLILKVGDDENHPQAAFLDRVGELIEEYEAFHVQEILEAAAAFRRQQK
jgi:hypothetical protein